jgi:hypothetical protein
MSRRDYISVEKTKMKINTPTVAASLQPSALILSNIIRYRYLVPTGLLHLGLLLRKVF